MNRVLDDYSTLCYLPAVRRTKRLLDGDRRELVSLIGEAAKVREFWDKILIKDVFTDADKRDLLFTGESIRVECYAYLGDADPSLFDVEVFCSHEDGGDYEILTLSFVEKYQDKTGKFEGNVILRHPGVQSMSLRLVPSNPDIRELYPELIKWRDS